MILELSDVTGTETGTAHIAMPEGVTLGEIFDADEKLKRVKARTTYVTLNGMRVEKWQDLRPGKNDRVAAICEPGDIGTILAITMAVISVVRFFISLFTSPQSPKTKPTTPTYSFEGLRHTYTPGGPVPVLYGEHETAGQVLMYYVDAIDRKHEKFAQLISLCEGPVNSIGPIYINNTLSTEFTGASSITIFLRYGSETPALLPGFETVKNTFYDGRDFTTDKEKKTTSSISLTPIIYSTIANDCQGIDLQVVFPDGVGAMRTVGADAGSIRRIWVEYEVEYSEQGKNDFQWIGTRRNSGKSRQPFIDTFHLDFPRAGAWDIQIQWWKSSRNVRYGTDMYRTVLQNVTEYRGPAVASAYAGLAMIGITGVANAKLQGGQPTITSVIRGREVKCFNTPTTFVNTWTENPAWCVLDYMTNSVYGMGPYISEADIDIQSFIDFATLCSSQVERCGPTGQKCIWSETNTGAVFSNEPHPIFNTFEPETTPFADVGYPVEAVSTFNGKAQAGLLTCRQCCPPGYFRGGPYGVNTPDDLCNYAEAAVQYAGGQGTPCTGFTLYCNSGHTGYPMGADYSNFTGYAFLYDQTNSANPTLAVVRYRNQSITTTGTILTTLPLSLGIGDVLEFIVSPVTNATVSSAYMINSGCELMVYQAQGGWTGFNLLVDIYDAKPPTGLGPQNGDELGFITMPYSHGGTNKAIWNSWQNYCGMCYGSTQMSLIDWDCDQPFNQTWQEIYFKG